MSTTKTENFSLTSLLALTRWWPRLDIPVECHLQKLQIWLSTLHWLKLKNYFDMEIIIRNWNPFWKCSRKRKSYFIMETDLVNQIRAICRLKIYHLDCFVAYFWTEPKSVLQINSKLKALKNRSNWNMKWNWDLTRPKKGILNIVA